MRTLLTATLAAAILLLIPGQAAAQTAPDIPEVVSPLKVETNFQGVNLITGKMTIDTPVLNVPGAPRLSFDRVQNLAPYIVGKTAHDSQSDVLLSSYSVHTGRGASASFSCVDEDCDPLNSVGAILEISGTGNNRTFTFYESGNGNVWIFDSKHTYQFYQGVETWLNYASKVTFPDGEEISYTYYKHTVPDSVGDRIYHRPTNVASNTGFHLTLTYHSAQFGVLGWSRPNVVELKNTATSAVVGKQTYSSDGQTITDLANRAYQCTNCANQLGEKIEREFGSLKIPGETLARFSATQDASSWVVGSVSREGISWNYTYSNLRGSFSRARYDDITVTGPSGIVQTYEFETTIPNIDENRLVASVDPEGRRTEYTFDNKSRPILIKYPEGNRAEIDYDIYDNIVEQRAIAKPGSGVANLVTSASYPTSNATLCNQFSVDVLCFRPVWVKDPKGNQTDYQYNSNGQVTQVLAPADASGVRAKTVIVYADNAAGISRPSSSTLCEGTENCTTQGISRTNYIYWGDTALPLKVCTTDIATSDVLITAYTYDAAGRKLSETQPLGVTGGCS